MKIKAQTIEIHPLNVSIDVIFHVRFFFGVFVFLRLETKRCWKCGKNIVSSERRKKIGMNAVRRQHIFTLSSVVHVDNRFLYSHIRSLHQTDGSMCSKSIVNILFEYFWMWFHRVVDMFASCALSFASFSFTAFISSNYYENNIVRSFRWISSNGVLFDALQCDCFCSITLELCCERIVPIFKMSHGIRCICKHKRIDVDFYFVCGEKKKQRRFENNKEQQCDVRLTASWSFNTSVWSTKICI